MRDLQNMIKNPVFLESLSEYRPEYKSSDEYRNYVDSEFIDRVKRTYYLMHENQTVEFVLGMKEKWCHFDHAEMTIMEALHQINGLIDESDPDLDLPNIYHAYQTAEKIRESFPDLDWLILVGLIHDLVQWAVVGDTFPVGCAFTDSIVFGSKSFETNPDRLNPLCNTELGIYTRGAGLSQVLMSWGHDEYMYQVLKNHGCTLPEIGMNVIRYHSFYPWHESDAYGYLCNDDDQLTKTWVKKFNSFDLYTKSENLPNIDELHGYYEKLIEKYIPGTLHW